MRIVISGYYGYGNLGDEAILAAMTAELHRRHPEAQLTVLSHTPEATASQYGVEAVSRWSLPAVWRTLRSADLLISGGGGLIQDATSALSPLYYLGLLRLAGLAGTPYMIFAQGLGPLRHSLTRWATARCFRHAAAITVRDEQSAQLLADLGVTTPPCEVTADPAVLLEPAQSTHIEELLVRYGLSAEQPLIGIAVRSWPGVEPVPPTATLLQYLDRSLAAQVILIPFQPEQDSGLAQQLASETRGHIAILDPPPEPREMLGIISRLDLLISMRLHGLIFAAAAQLPAVAVAYDPKVAAFAARAHQPMIRLSDLSGDRLVREVQKLWESRAQQAARRRDAARSLRQAAADNFEILAEVVASLRCRERRADGPRRSRGEAAN